LKQLVSVVKDGLKHGFFEFGVSGEIVKDRKRRLTIKAGKSHQFTIPEDELKN
jgi:RNase P/RNase MRP subunit p29